MLYIFHVDTGTMMTFDMNLAMDTSLDEKEKCVHDFRVMRLQEVIAKVCRIPTDKQVLLISGGESLDQTAKVCTYSAGTQFDDVGKEELRACEKLVHDQHLQHQGWAAVVANLEDITSAFQARAKVFVQSMHEYISNRHLYIEILSSFGETLELLRRIPLLPCLLGEGDEGVFTSAYQSSYSITTPHDDSSPSNLLEWINAQDSKNTLEQMRNQCHSGLDQFDETVQESLDEEVKSVVESINNHSMKEVKGLEDRLYGLEQLMFGARRLIKEQSEMAQGFVQNQARASNLQDPSVLPDLCMSHRSQLKVILKNYQSMQDIRNRCMAAKEELSINLHTRLRWVMYVERTICDVDSKLVLHHENLKKLRRRLEILQQMHNAPFIYCSAVVEVIYEVLTNEWFQWSSSLAEECSSVRNSEVAKRETFKSCLRHHFLQALFPGFNDMPPDFATESPSTFDDQLPSIQAEDLDFLKQKVPELAQNLTVPEADSACAQLLDYFPSKPANATSDAQCLSMNLKLPLAADVAQSVTSDIVVLDHNGEHEEVLNMNEEEKRKEPLGKSTGINVCSGGDHQLIAEQDILLAESPQEPPMKIERMRSPCTPPDADEHEGFTTADFYIDESLPSSMTESARSRKLVELQQSVQEKAVALEFKEAELSEQKAAAEELKCRLNKMNDNFKALREVAEKGALQLKCEVLGLEKQALKERDDMRVCVDNVTRGVVDVISKFQEQQERIREQVVKGLKTEKERLIEEYEAKLELEKERVLDSHRELQLGEAMLSAKIEELDCLQRTTERKIDGMGKKHEEELSEIRKQMMLEHEVELDKMRDEWRRDGEKMELELKDVILQRDQRIEEILKEKEALLAQFEEDKTHCLEELRDKCEIMKEAALKESREVTQREMEVSKKEHAETCEGIRREMKRDHEEEVERWKAKCQELEDKMREAEEQHAKEKEEWMREEDEPVVHLIEDDYLPMERHEQILYQLKQTLQDEKESSMAQALAEQREEHENELQKMREEMENQLQQSMKSSLTAEKQVIFNEALDRVVQECDAKIHNLEKKQEVLTEQAAVDKKQIADLEAEVKGYKERHAGVERDDEAKASDDVLMLRKLEEELTQSKQLITQLQASVMAASVTPVNMDPAETVQRLEMSLRKKEEEMGRLQHKVIELMNACSTLTSDQSAFGVSPE
ncbi:hypothetical protein CAPTEDRAFT_226747 [Capitella teleta]|uniref:RB1-inducible coiled-coil protein 1 n=1 Tax=Capitella teleta TaxID=283909 RepID=N1PB36_CAPTE|nr:hypothetical protein CAPTEDRAFT_226747 [Capitella teleta]|eukprot:ELU18827.1 hypothetical protein CAPTEDRAFT_226747 [Capitella teleta]